MKLSHVYAQPSHETFMIRPIRLLILRYMARYKGTWLDPFARNNHLATITNDINPDTAADCHLDAVDFLRMYDRSIAGILIDPPYSPRQIMECYQACGLSGYDTKLSFWGDLRKEIRRIQPTCVIWCGWNSTGVGKKAGYVIKELLLVNHGSNHNDTIVTVSIKQYESLLFISETAVEVEEQR